MVLNFGTHRDLDHFSLRSVSLSIALVGSLFEFLIYSAEFSEVCFRESRAGRNRFRFGLTARGDDDDALYVYCRQYATSVIRVYYSSAACYPRQTRCKAAFRLRPTVVADR